MVRIEALAIYGDMELGVAYLLVRILASDDVRALIERELVEDFSHDYDSVIGKAQKGIEAVNVGDLELSFDVKELEHGAISATGKGLFMPVSAKGSVATRLDN